jgi:hypothetical protein
MARNDFARPDIVPGFEIDPTCPHAGGTLILKGRCPEILALERRYTGVRMNSVDVRSLSVWAMTVAAANWDKEDDLVSVSFSVTGTFDDLERHRFAYPGWKELPKCGARHYFTEGFGSAGVRLRKDGQFTVANAYLVHALDLVAPVFLPKPYHF